MHLYKCDKCGKAITDEKSLHAGPGLLIKNYQFCQKCGKPIADMLKRYKLDEYEKET